MDGSEIGAVRITAAEPMTPAFSGRVFGDAGVYVCLSGTVTGELDPSHPQNAGIVNLDRAPRNNAGRVEYRAPFCLLRPADLGRGNGWLLYDVVNRGNKLALTRLNYGAEGNDLLTPAHAGDGMLMRHGFSVLWSGWQAGVPDGAGRLVATFPIAANPDGPISQRIRDEFIAEGIGGPGDAFIQDIDETRFSARLSYAAVSVDAASCSLTVRQRERDQRVVPPGLVWRFIDSNHIEIRRPPGFDKGAIYEFIYTARDPAVMGIGFAAIRDLVSALRHDTSSANPLCGGIRHALGFGISQSGRVLRDFVHLGFNKDLNGRKVFDAVMPVVGGSRRTFINHAFAQPGRYARQHEDHSFPDDQFPFSYPVTSDAISGRIDGILRRAVADGVAPKIMHLDADSDLWAGRASLVATDTRGNDLPMPDNVRLYLASSVQHAVYRPNAPTAAQLPGNPLGYGAWMRALLIALVAWAEHGQQPPASRFPSRSAGTLVTREEAERGFPALPGVEFPGVLNELHLRDHSTEPPLEGPAYPVLVCAVDRDGNSLGGLRHPLVTAPLATYTGWAVRGPGYAPGDLFSVQGSMIPFAATEAERQAGDPRPSVEARYGSRDTWALRVAEAAEQLVADRLLLREDADRLIAAARESYDVAAVL